MNIFSKAIGWVYFAWLSISCLQWPEEKGTAHVNGQDLFYVMRGPADGRPVLLIHGNGGSHKSMTTQAMQLAKAGYRVYSPDSRGQGANAPLQEYHYADMAEDMYCFVREVILPNSCKAPIYSNVEESAIGNQTSSSESGKVATDSRKTGEAEEKVAIYGWSDGGIIALMMEMEHPGFCGPMAVSGANLKPDCGPDFESFKQWILSEGTPIAMMMLSEPNIEKEELAAIECPVLVTAGDKDLISEEHTRMIADGIPDSELLIFKNATHGSYIKRSPKMGKALLDFLARKGYNPRMENNAK